MTTLLEIGGNINALVELVAELPDGELTPEVEAALDALFNENRAELIPKLDGYCALVRSMTLRAKARKDEADRLLALVTAEENAVKRLKERMQLFMEMTSQKRLDTRRYRITLQGNGGKVPVDVEVPAVALPPAYQRVTIEADKELIRDALLAGEVIDGCRLRERGQHVRIT